MQTDLTYFFVSGWGWYYLGGILDDFSRYLICFDVKKDMKGPTLSDLVQKAVEITPKNLFQFDNKFVLEGADVTDGEHTVELKKSVESVLRYSPMSIRSTQPGVPASASGSLP